MNDLVYFLGRAAGPLCLGLAVIGSAIGAGAAGQAAAGAWAREGKEGRTLSFTYVMLCGFPLSQTIYGLVMLLALAPAVAAADLTQAQAGQLAACGFVCGLAQLSSAWLQGKVCAAGIRGLVENGGKGLINIIMAAGIVETVGLFGMIFTYIFLKPDMAQPAAEAANLLKDAAAAYTP